MRILPAGLLLAATLAAAPPPRIVSIDVSATDTKGRFVPDLQPSDLRIADAGKPQQIVFFRRGDTIPHAVAVLIDQLNGDLEQQTTEWSKILRALSRSEFGFDPFIYVLTRSGALYPVNPIPDTWAGWTPPELSWQRDILPILEGVRNAYREQQDYTKDAIEPRPRATAWAIEELRVRLAELPGHASVVWAGPAGWGRIESSLPHDARRIDGSELRDVPVYISGSPSAKGPEAWTIRPYSDIREVIPRASAEAQQYYRVAWIPPESNWNGKIHHVNIACTRPGVQVNSKDTYSAPKLLDVADDQRQAAPDVLPLIGFDSSQVRFTMSLTGSRIEIQVSSADLVQHRGAAQLAAAVMEAAAGESRPLLGGVHSWEGAITAASVPITFDIPAPLPAALRVIVLDRISGGFGTRTIRRKL